MPDEFLLPGRCHGAHEMPGGEAGANRGWRLRRLHRLGWEGEGWGRGRGREKDRGEREDSECVCVRERERVWEGRWSSVGLIGFLP